MVLAIYGAGGLGREILELARIINESQMRWSDFIFADDEVPKPDVQNCTVMSLEQIKKKYDDVEYTVAVGEPAIRKLIYDRLTDAGCRIATLIHPDVRIPETTVVGDGSIISYGCFVSCNVVIGKNVLLQPSANIGHDDVIGDHCVVSTTCAMGGACILGEQAYLGLGAVVREMIHIGASSVVGMGAVVIRDVEDEAVVSGNPARKMLNNKDHRVFHH